MRHLKFFSLLLEIQSLTRAAEILGTSQPALSKALTKLRAHFGDPLFVRVGAAMRPTPRALHLTEPLRALLDASQSLRSSRIDFDPATSTREFKVIVTEVGMIRLVPPLMNELEKAGRGLRLKALPLDSRDLSTKLETGEADVALGAFPGAPGNLLRQRLYADTYVSVARADHPRLGRLTNLESFLEERHIIVTASSTGHAAHRLLEQVLLSKLQSAHIQISIPSFVTSAFVASRTDAIGTMPTQLASYLAAELKLAVFSTPLKLPAIEIEQFWHERVSSDSAHRWLCSTIHRLFAQLRTQTPPRAPR